MHYGRVISNPCKWSLEAASWAQEETSILLKIKWYLAMAGVLEARAANRVFQSFLELLPLHPPATMVMIY